MKRWEYNWAQKIFETPIDETFSDSAEDITKWLNKLGEQGWNIVSITVGRSPNYPIVTIFAKRRWHP